MYDYNLNTVVCRQLLLNSKVMYTETYTTNFERGGGEGLNINICISGTKHNVISKYTK